MKTSTTFRFVAAAVFAAAAIFFAAQNFNTMEAKADQAAPASQPAKWIKLFADEDWYKNQKANEEVFSGTLEAVKPPPGATILMRSSYYRLGSRNIYTAGKKVEALDGLVGKNVEIKGKPYDISLEGQAVSEIWPAEIRQVEAATAPAVPKKSG